MVFSASVSTTAAWKLAATSSDVELRVDPLVLAHEERNVVPDRCLEAAEAEVVPGKMAAREFYCPGIALLRKLVEHRAAGVFQSHELRHFIIRFARGIVPCLAEQAIRSG